ncbi:MAG: site-specific integrase [Rhodospirillales bacterium]|nr:site-specific integrase [Rhodospirillales bacterium]
MARGKQAKTLTDRQVALIARHLETTRNPLRNRVMLLLSVKAGLRAKEIASLTWGMVTDSSDDLADCMALPDVATKGRSGRLVPLNSDLKAVLKALQQERAGKALPDAAIIYSERGRRMSAASVVEWFCDLYRDLGFSGCSSHSGRRTFITKAARRIVEAGGSLRDVQELAGHSSLSTTQRYIEGDSEAKRRVVNMI